MKVSSTLNLSFGVFLWLVGVIGNTLNTLVLSQRSLRSNSCAWLFLISSIFNLISILFGLTSRILSSWLLDITDSIQLLCQLRVFVLLDSRTIASWLLMLATLDRWLLSCRNARFRHKSKLRNAQRGTIAVILLSSLVYSPVFYCYRANLTDAPMRCYGGTIRCRILADQTYIFLTILVPLILIMLFGFLTMSNLRRIHSRIRTPLITPFRRLGLNRHLRRRLKTIDRHLLMMLLVQISFLSILTLPQAVQMIYMTITSGLVKSPLRTTIESSILDFTVLLTYLASGMPFYIYTLSGGYIFRQTLSDLLSRITCRPIFPLVTP